jgi:pentatricopeptide repeat protein
MCWIERVYFQVLQTEASRLLKMDLLMTLVELRRQDECALAIQVTQTLCVPLSSCSQILIFQGKFFHFLGYFVVYVNHPQHSAVQIFEMVRKEPWYKPDRFLYREMMDTLGRNQLIEEVERLYKDLQDEGLKSDAMILTELMGAYIRCDKVPRAFELYQDMKSSGLQLEKVTYEILCRGLKKARDFEHLQIVIDDCRQAFPGLVPPYSKQMDAHSTGDREKSHA